MSPGDLAVIIPTRGRWSILRRTLDALQAQTVQGFEIIVVVDGTDQDVPDDLPATRVIQQRQGGPAAARNRGVASTDRPLVLLLGDDMIPRRSLVARHLSAHSRHPDPTTAVLGHVDWHPSVAWRPENRWLDRSGTQFDYVNLPRQADQDVGFGRFYSCNVSLKRALYDQVDGFDEDFIFYYEDLDMGWRLAQAGMNLRYEPEARTRHMHAYTVNKVLARFEGIALGERMMAAKHDWFTPWFRDRVAASRSQPPVSRAWRLLSQVPAPPAVRRRLVGRATRWYHHQVADRFTDTWQRAGLVTELADWLGDDFDASQLIHHASAVEDELSAIGDEVEFYRQSTSYLYDLVVFSMSGTKDPYHAVIHDHVPTGARLLDYGCGIGADGVQLLDRGYDVSFADYASPSTNFLAWRLKQRDVATLPYDIERDEVPSGFDLAYAFDVIEHVDDPWDLLARLEARGGLVLVNLLEEDEHDHEHHMHRELPIDEIVAHAGRRGLVSHTVHHGRSHLVLYRGDGA